MSVICVPPERTSPYQNGAGAFTKLTSLNVLLLHAEMGFEASAVPLRKRQVLAVGNTVAEAFNNAYRLERACRTQLMAQNAADEILIPEKAVVEKTAEMYKPGTRRRMGLLEWPAMRRLADRIDPSYKN